MNNKQRKHKFNYIGYIQAMFSKGVRPIHTFEVVKYIKDKLVYLKPSIAPIKRISDIDIQKEVMKALQTMVRKKHKYWDFIKDNHDTSIADFVPNPNPNNRGTIK